jgi:hypothetical protein
LAKLDLSDADLWQPKYLDAVTDPKTYNILWGGAGCFYSKQKIVTILGSKFISEIKNGDLVLSYNHKLQSYEFRPVLQKFKYDDHSDRLIEIKMKDGTIIKVTENHKFFLDGQYRHIKDILLDLQNGKDMENNTRI